uniref:Uncharacterized protein n=1 Tax=Ananas comosus var. bracteatus TaxID=296719 RepID=A0A6V7PTZ5_ANACO|nr:unnamed protein product [Ananas comosus var. bracteatus]
MLLRLGCVPTVVVSSAPAAQQVMKAKDLTFASRPPARIPNALLYDGDIGFSPYGEYWRQVIPLCGAYASCTCSASGACSPSATSEKKRLRCWSTRSALLPSLPRRSRRQPACRQSHKRRHLRVAFGRKYSAEGGGAAKIQATLAEFAALLGTVEIGEFVPWLGWIDRLRGLDRRVRDNSRELDAMLERVLEDHCSGNEEGDDLVDVLLSINDKDEKVGIALTRSNIKAILLNMFAAGTDTSSTTIDWLKPQTEIIMPPLTQLFQLLLHQNSIHVASFFLSILIITFSVFSWNPGQAPTPLPPRARWEARAVMLLRLGRVPTVVVSSAPAAQQVMKAKDLTFASRPPARISNALLYSSDIAVSPYGEYWRQVRRICVLHLLSLKRVQSFRYVRQEEAALLVDKIRATVAAAATTSSTVDVSQLVVNLTNDVTCRVAFGRKYSAEGGGAAKIQATLAEFAALLGRWRSESSFPG